MIKKVVIVRNREDTTEFTVHFSQEIIEIVNEFD